MHTVLDAETTGTDPQSDRIVELAVCTYEGPSMLVGTTWRVNPGRPIPSEASAIHGIADPDVAGKPLFAAIAPEVQVRLGPHIAVGYNIRRFDGPLLRRHLAESGIEWDVPLLDVYDFVAWYYRGLPTGARKLKNMAERMGVPLYEAHNARSDAVATQGILQEMQHLGLCQYDIKRAQAQSEYIAGILKREYDKWSYFIYIRDDKIPRIGFGKYCGRPLIEVPPHYFVTCFEKLNMRPRMPADVIKAFECRIARQNIDWLTDGL